MNKVTLIGRLGKEPELKTSNSGNSFVKLSLATSKKYNGEEKTQWHNIVAFGKTAEFIERNCYKGQLIYVEGEINYNNYTDKSGEKKSFTEILVNQFQVLEWSPKEYYNEQSNTNRNSNNNNIDNETSKNDYYYEDEIPF